MLHKVDYWHEKIYMCKNYKILNFSLGDFTEHQYLLGLLNTTKSRVFHLSEPLLSSWDTEKCILSCNVATARRQTWQQVVAFDTELVLESVSVAFYRPSSEACCLTTFSFLTVMASSQAGTESPASAANTHHRPLDHQQCRLSTITAGLQQIQHCIVNVLYVMGTAMKLGKVFTLQLWSSIPAFGTSALTLYHKRTV